MMETVCPKCGGSGWRVVEREEVSAAERCDCVASDRARRLQEQANIPPLYQGASFENFSTTYSGNPIAQQQLSGAMTLVRTFATQFPLTNPPGLLIIGDPGVGKTHLAVAALRRVLAKGFEGVFFDYQSLLEMIRKGWTPEAGTSEREAYSTAMETEVLLLDDLGAFRVLDWVEDVVAAIITYRCNHRKPLIATTNLDDPETSDSMLEANRYKTSLADRIGSRARSRLFEMCRVVRIVGVGDYRSRRRVDA